MFFKLIPLAAALILVGCSNPEQKPTIEQLKGHWHVVKANYAIQTLDVFDSSAIIDSYSLLSQPLETLLHDTAGNILLPDLCCSEGIASCVEKFHLSGDSLIYDTSRHGPCVPTKFVRSDLNKCMLSHIVDDKFLLTESLKLPIKNGAILNWDSTKRKCRDGVIVVGLLKGSSIQPKIQVNDVFITTQDVPALPKRSHWRKSSFDVCLAIDDRVRKSFADSVINAIPKSDSLKLYRLVTVKGSNELGYERMN